MQTNYLIHKIYNTLKNNEVEVRLRRMGKEYDGMYFALDDNSEDNWAVVEVDFNTNFIPVLCHEIIHHLYPKKTEREVLKLEAQIKKELSYLQAGNIIMLVSDNIKYYRHLKQQLK